MPVSSEDGRETVLPPGNGGEHASPASSRDEPAISNKPEETKGEGTQGKEKPKKASKIPAWASSAFKDKRKMKTFIRCFIVLMINLVYLLTHKTLHVFGQAGFFGLIVSCMIPPFLPTTLFLLASITLILGMLLGWAFGVAAMAAALAARNPAVTLAATNKFKASITNPATVAAAQQQALFEGLWLDPRSSAVFGVFFFFAVFFFGFVRANVPKLMLFATFGTIVMDVMCTYGVFFPSEYYTLARLFLIPTGVYVGTAVVSTLLIFPETMSHAWLASLESDVLSPILHLLKLQSTMLATPASEIEKWDAMAAEGKTTRGGLIKGLQTALGGLGTIDLEVYRARIGAGDLKNMATPVRTLSYRTLGLTSFLWVVSEKSRMERAEESKREEFEKSHAGMETPNRSRFSTVRSKLREREESRGLSLRVLRPLLESCSLELRDACATVIQDRVDWLNLVNRTRMSFRLNKKEMEDSLKASQLLLADLKRILKEFKDERRHEILQPFTPFFNKDTGKLLEEYTYNRSQAFRSQGTIMTESLFHCMVFNTTLESFADATINYANLLIELESRRTRNRIWWPTGFGKIWRKLQSKSGPTGEGGGFQMGTAVDVENIEDFETETLVEPEDEYTDMKSTMHVDPDAGPPRTALGRSNAYFAKFFHWFGTTKGLFCLRYSLVSMGFFAFAVAPSTAHFNYVNRGLWALIMSQTGMGMNAGEQIGGFILRVGGTIIGLVLGMLAWYIGSGHGNGNPYGLFFITCAIVGPLLFARLYCPPPLMVVWLMAAVMVVFVVGYSYVDAVLAVVNNPGIGVFLAWKRAVLVIIGFTAGFVVMLFPKPTSARQTVRKTLAASMSELGKLIAAEVEFFMVQSKAAPSVERENRKEARIEVISKTVTAIASQLDTVPAMMGTAKFEPTFKGPWPSDKYGRLFKAQGDLLNSMVILSKPLHELDHDWAAMLVKSPFLNPEVLADVFSTILIVSRSLKHGLPIPGSLPALRDRLVYHARFAMIFARNGPSEKSLDTDSDSDLHPEEKLNQATLSLRDISFEALRSDQMAIHSAAIVAFGQMFSALDEITDVVKDICGTMETMKGFEALYQDLLKREEDEIRRRIEEKA